MKKTLLQVLVLCSFLLLFPVVQAQSPSGYHLLKKVTLGGEGGWDYLIVDAKARRVYILRSTHVMVVDADTGAVVGDIPDTSGVHGIAIAEDLNRGFTSNGRAGTVSVFDLKTLKVLQQVPVGKNPDAIIYDDASKRVFTFNGGSNDSTAIDAETGKVVGTIALGGKPEFATSDGKGHVYANIEDKSLVVSIDSKKLTVENQWPLKPGEEPSGMAIDRAHHRLFIGCSNKLMAVVNAENGQVVTTLPIGSGVDANGFDPEPRLAFSSNGEGTLTIVHEDSADKFSVLENVTTQRGARTMAVDTKAHHVLLVTADFGPAPAPTAERPRPRPAMIPGTFSLLIFGK